MTKHRHHHYVPAFYLAHFTRGGGRSEQLCVFDLERQRTWKATPGAAGQEKDFYRIDADGVDPLAVERDFFQRIEDPAASAFKAILGAAHGTANAGMTRAFVNHEDLYALLRFVAVQAVRGPDHRASYDDLHSDLANGLLHAIAKDDALFDQRKKDNPALEGTTRDEFQQSVDGNPVRVKVPPTSQIYGALELVPQVLQNLIARGWKVSIAPPGAPALACTDKPVVLIPPPDSPPKMPCGFATPGVTVLMPLSRTTVLVSSSVFPPSDEYISVEYMPTEDVPVLNTLIVGGAYRYAYCADEDLVHIADEGGRRGGKKELLDNAGHIVREREQPARDSKEKKKKRR